MSAPCYLYCIEALDEFPVIKVGVSRDPGKRLRQLQTASPYPLRIARLWTMETRADAVAMERAMHLLLSPKAMVGEWFDAAPSTASHAATLVGLVRAQSQTKREYERKFEIVRAELKRIHEAHR